MNQQPQVYQPVPMAESHRSLKPRPPEPMEVSRPRTPAEALDDMFIATAQVATLKAVSLMAQESLVAVERRRQEIAAELPQIEVLLHGLLVNHAIQLAEVQRFVATNEKRSVE